MAVKFWQDNWIVPDPLKVIYGNMAITNLLFLMILWVIYGNIWNWLKGRRKRNFGW